MKTKEMIKRGREKKQENSFKKKTKKRINRGNERKTRKLSTKDKK